MTQGKAWLFGKDVNTDALAPGAYMQFGVPVIAKHCLSALRPEFAAQVQSGDFLVADENFGVGSSREQAAQVLRHLGVSAVIAPSFSGLFFRNAFNIGLLLITCKDAALITDHESISMHIGYNNPSIQLTNGTTLHCDPIPEFLLNMVRAGGLLPMLKEQRHRHA